jgi:hypothetical protein
MRLPGDKYYGVNFLHINNDKDSQRLEFRYIGGKDYEKNLGQLIYFLERFIILTHDTIDTDFSSEDVNKLEEYLEDNISTFKNLSKYDNFIVDFPTIQLQIDQDGNYDVVSAYYTKIYNKLFNLIDGSDNLKECIVNYVTTTQTMEIIDATIKSTSTIKGYDLVNCICEGIYEDCLFAASEINNSQLVKCRLFNSDAKDTKILNCKVDGSSLTNCYFMDGYLNGDMFGGVYRSGKLGPYATMDADVKIVTDNDNFFDTTYDDETKGDGKGQIKGFGKK